MEHYKWTAYRFEGMELKLTKFYQLGLGIFKNQCMVFLQTLILHSVNLIIFITPRKLVEECKKGRMTLLLRQLCMFMKLTSYLLLCNYVAKVIAELNKNRSMKCLNETKQMVTI
jgi:hypothetical protein